MPRRSIYFAFLLTGALCFGVGAGLGQTEPSVGAVPTLKAKAQLVVVDVVVTDSKHEPVHNLKASDFTVMENSSRQQVASFEEHVTIPPDKAAKIAPMRPLPPGIFTNFTPVPVGSSVNVLLLDNLDTPLMDQPFVRDQLLEYLKNAPAGTRIAIFGLNSRLVMLQGFTSDPEVLRAAVGRSGAGASLALRADPLGVGGYGASVAQDFADATGGAADMGQVLDLVKQAEADQNAASAQLGAMGALDAMNQIAHYLAGIPGRKNLIWFSGSFPINIVPKPDQLHPFNGPEGLEKEFRETTNLLARSQVAVYPIAAHGLATFSILPITSKSAVTLGVANKATDDFAEANADARITMEQIAGGTGGEAYVDVNGLSEAVGRAIANGSNYYTLSYVPTNSKRDGQFRRIQVKLAARGLNVSYRNGYYADEPEGKPRRGVESATTSSAQNNAPAAVMRRGAPVATEIMLKLQVRPASDALEDAVAPLNVTVADPAKKVMVNGPFRRYGIDVAADAGDIQVTPTAEGRYAYAVEMITYVYNGSGGLVNTAVERVKGNLLAATFSNMRRVGVPFHQEISVPADGGEYYLRTAVHDLNTDRYGVVEIPVAAVAKLPVLNTASTSVPSGK